MRITVHLDRSDGYTDHQDDQQELAALASAVGAAAEAHIGRPVRVLVRCGSNGLAVMEVFNEASESVAWGAGFDLLSSDEKVAGRAER